MLTRAIRVKPPGLFRIGGVKRRTSAVPSQLLPAKTTGSSAGFGVGLPADDAAKTATSTQASSASPPAAAPLIGPAVPLRPRTWMPPVTGGSYPRQPRANPRRLPVPGIARGDAVEHERRLDPVHRVRPGRREVVIELARTERLEPAFDRGSVGREDDRVL